MNRPALDPSARLRLIWFSVGVLTLAITLQSRAGIGLPAMPDQSDTNAMEQYRISRFYEGEKSYQEKLKVGRERYYYMLSNRNGVVAAMVRELEDRKKVIGVQAAAASRSSYYVEGEKSNTWFITALGAAVIGLGLLGFRYYLNRQNVKGASGRER
jgi:hypothetical protein